MELMAKSVKAVMDRLRVKKYVLAGHSMGGSVALAFADLYPDHLRVLALIYGRKARGSTAIYSTAC
jgi:pimeloyl-ACP methyl ester carboxylesterase